MARCPTPSGERRIDDRTEETLTAPTSRPPFPPLRFRACAQSEQRGPSCHCRRTSSPATRSCCTTSTAASARSGAVPGTPRRPPAEAACRAVRRRPGDSRLVRAGTRSFRHLAVRRRRLRACDDNDALLSRCCACCRAWRHLRWLRLLPAWLRDEVPRGAGATAGAGSAASAHPFVVAPGVPVEPDASPALAVAGYAACAPACGPILPWPLTRANADDCATRYPTPSSTLSWSPRISPGG